MRRIQAITHSSIRTPKSTITLAQRNRSLPLAQQDWFIYGTLDAWICEALDKYPVANRRVVNIGSMTPWYEAMLIHFGAKPTIIDYNPIVTRTERMAFMTISIGQRDRPLFDVGFSASSPDQRNAAFGSSEAFWNASVS